MEEEYGQAAETTMSFVLKLDVDVEATTASVVENVTKGGEGQPPTLLFAREIWRSQEPVAIATDTNNTSTGNAVMIASSDDVVAAACGGKSQLLQCLEAASNQAQQPTAATASALTTVKPVVTYPVAKGAREQVQKMIAGSQTNTTQVLTTRVISQKLPSSSSQAQPVPLAILNTSPVSTQSSLVASNMQALHPKFHPVSVQQHIVGTAAAVKTIATMAATNLQRIQVKTGSSSVITSQSAQKGKTVTNANQTTQSAGAAQRNNSLSRAQNMQKSQMLTNQINQLTVNNQTIANSQKIQQANPVIQKTTQTVNAQKSVCNNQVSSQLLSSGHHPNHKVQQQQNLQKLQGPQKTLAMTRQQQLTVQQVNNVPKSSGPGLQKIQTQQQQPTANQQQAPHQRSQSTGLQKSQTILNTNRIPTTMSNVCKSNSVPNISKVPPQNSNVLGNKQSHAQPTSTQLQQQIVQTSQQQSIMQKSQQQQPTNANNLQAQRSHSITNMHQKVVATMNNQRTHAVINSKIQQQQQQPLQQMMMRVGISKGQTPQASQSTAGLKSVSQKMMNPVKVTANSQNNAVQQPVVQRNSPTMNIPTMKILAQQREQQLLQQQRQQQQQQQHQQHQNVINPQNAPQKQPGCIKTIPPQKPVQRNHAQKVGGSGIKTSLNTNVTALPKTQGSTAIQIAQKGCIKTLLQQTATVASSNVMAPHKSSPIKIQPQAMQQKQLIMTPQYTQQIRQQSGQIKTLLPVSSTMTENLRKDLIEIKNETELRISKEEEQSARKSPVRRMPLPYECLQFVLQDHNYGAPPPRTPPPPPSSPPHPKQQPINGAGSSTATSQHPYIFGPVVSNTNTEDDAASTISSEAGREAEPEGEETETAPEGEGDDEDSVTRCICDFEHDDGYMICCDRCLVWQHVDCMGIDRSNIPDEYLCERCRPRRVDRQRARTLQMRKREELLNSDTSSDTSSTSSADTDVGSVNATVQKKRSLSQQQQQPSSQIPRRGKSDAPTQSAQVRRLNNNNNNNNNVAKRQRRDSHARQSSAVRKKENATPKRGPGKRKAKRRMSLEDKEEDVQDAWGSNMAPLRQWIERYEEAVTNHYSPELRARISSIKVNGTHSDLRQTNMNVIATGKCRLNVHSNNLRFLVATMYLPPNTPVVELRGKYMLSTQHRSQHPQGGRQHAQRPGPFVFFYRLPRDGTEVCVDTRTYGNDARFVRRSCKPNAEVKHCIEKGTLHLYIVTTCAIEKNAEITIKHEQHDLLLSPNPGSSPALPVVCACNNPRECQIANAANQQLNRRGSNGALIENADGRERRRRGRRNTVCEETDPPAPPVPTSIAQQVTSTATSSAPSTVTVTTPRKTVTTTVTVSTTRQVPKEEPTATVTNVQPQSSPGLRESVATPETKKDKKKMTREERKMEAIMKAIERMEKAEQRRQEVQARNAQRKESSGTHSDNEDNNPTTGQSSKSGKQASSDRPLRRKRRKGRARTTSTSQSQNANNRRTRLNSAESDVSSGDESNSMQSPPLLGRPPSREVPYSSHLHTPAKNTVAIGDSASNVGPSSGGHHSGIPTAAGLLLALANSNVPGPPSSPPLQQPTPVKSPTCDSGASSSSQSSTPSTPLSSACLLVAAAVGPLAPGFKFPKTKKVLMNEWLKESPDPPQANVPQVSPLPALPSAPTLQNSVNHPLCGRHFPPLPATDPTAEFLSQSYAAKSLATLVQAANSVSGICDSPPQRRQQQQGASTPCNNNNNGGSSGGCPTGSAKKRWLRQAISEECDSPNSRPESPPSLSETVAPPKKRRIARESLSSENYTPPTTPTMLLPTEAASNNRSLCPAEDDYAEREQSPFVEQNDEVHYESESVKEEVNADGRPIDSDESVVRKKISVDTFSQSDFYMTCNEEKCSDFSDIVKAKISPVMSAESATIKEEKVFPKWEKGDIKTECNYSSLDPKIFAKIQKVVESGVSFSDLNLKKEPFLKKEEQGTVEIIHHNISHTEIEEYPSPMEPDEILEQRVAELQLEFGGIDEISLNVASDENKKSENKSAETVAKCQEIVVEKSDDNASIDEFDVEAQMKKITGDDGNDYQEKIDTSSEKDKSMDGIEGLMESSKEDSDSEDKDMDDDKYCESSFKLFDIKHEEAPFNELDAKPDVKSEQVSLMEDDVKETIKEDANDEASKEAPKMESSFTALSEESIFESASSNAESVLDPPKIFHSIPPLSERIRKKADPAAAPKAPKMDFEAAIIESTITMDTVEESTNGEEKSMLSTALRELLEAKLEDEPEVIKNDIDNEISASSQVAQPKSDISPERSLDVVQDSSTAQEAPKPEEAPVKEEETKPKEIKRLKDPRTVVPNNMPAPPAFKPDALPPVKRKLSISEYRKRKQQSSGGAGAEPESSKDDSTADKSGARGRSDSTSSGTSSLSSDEEGSKASATLDLSGVTTLTLFPNATNENDEKKGGEEGTIGWSAAPTLVERQRENLTERLKREFGLFLSDDEEERARKHGLTAEAILKAHKSPPQNLVANTPPGYPGLQQLPPQPYIPPPGSASIHYPQFQSKPAPVQYPNFAMPPQTTSSTQQPMYGTAVPSQAGGAASKQVQQQFLVPQASQAPPGSNPYPPPQFVPPPPPPAVATATTVATASAPATTTGTTVPKFSSTTPPPPGNQAYPPPTSSGQPQKPFFNHPAPPRS